MELLRSEQYLYFLDLFSSSQEAAQQGRPMRNFLNVAHSDFVADRADIIARANAARAQAAGAAMRAGGDVMVRISFILI